MPSPDTIEAAEAAGLRYVSDGEPGIRRRRAGKGFSYRAPDGSTVRDETDLERIKLLGIPPAWSEVWICLDPVGHIQATGRDVKGRKQYRYHPRWRSLRDETKYDRMLVFADALPQIREHTERDLAQAGLPRAKVLATVVQLLEATLIRVGNQEYARDNRSFGLTTLRDRHVVVRGQRIEFRFRGKSGKEHNITLQNRRLAKIVQRCQEIPGQDLFQYLDESGQRLTISSADVNAYLREIGGDDFSAKDFRTWAGTISTALSLEQIGPARTAAQAKRNLNQAIKDAAERLGNTPTICRNCYVHPLITAAYADGRLLDALTGADSGKRPRLRPDEARVIGALEDLLKR